MDWLKGKPGKTYRKAIYLMGKSIWFPVDFPSNQSIDKPKDENDKDWNFHDDFGWVQKCCNYLSETLKSLLRVVQSSSTVPLVPLTSVGANIWVKYIDV